MRRATSVAALCLVTFLQAYLLVSVFPYGAYLAVHLWNRPSAYAENTHPITVEEAGPYAALFATSFMIGRTAAAVIWGNLADVYGRKWVLLASLVGSGVASLWFGMCTSYANAVVARGVMGAWNSIVGVSKTLATELAYHDFGSDGDSGHDCAEECVQLSNEDLHLQEGNAIPSSCKVAVDHDATKEHLETRIVGLVTSMRAWGFLIAPAIAGLLADPLNCREGCMHTREQSAQSIAIFRSALERYPYLLPNVLGAIISWIAGLAVYFGMPETLPGHRRGMWLKCTKRRQYTKDQVPVGADATRVVQYGSIDDAYDGDDHQCQSTSIPSIWSRANTRYHLLAYWCYSLIIIAIDEAFPLYCISRTNGLTHGLSEPEIGGVLSLSGLIFAVAQFTAYTTIVDRWGLHGSLRFGCYFGVLPVVLIPLASSFTGYGALLHLAFLMGATKIAQSTFFSSVTIATNHTVPSDARSRMNGVGGMGAGVAKAVGPMLSGFWMARWLSLDHNAGRHLSFQSFVAFGGIASLAIPLLALLPLLDNDE